MAALALVTELSDLLQTHANRDKVVSLASYALKLCGSAALTPARRRDTLLKISGRLNLARATSRLFDDASALKAFMAYGLGAKEGKWWGALGAAGHCCTLAYLQAEKVIWLLDLRLLALSEEADSRWRTAHKLFWTLFSAISFIRSIRAVHYAALELKSPTGRRCARARLDAACVACAKCLLDTVHAGSWLPPGWGWGGRVSAPRAAALAVAAATLALTNHYQNKRLATTK